jgi:signal peptidase
MTAYDGTLSTKGTKVSPRRIARWLLLATWFVVLTACTVTSSLVVAAVGPELFGYNSYIISGGSMEPAIQAGSVAVTRPTRVEALEVGDIITFQRPEGPGTNITHRIIAIDIEDGQRVFATKGDAEDNFDTEQVRLQGEVDRLAYDVPYAGYIVNFARSRAGLISLLVVPAVMLLSLELRSLKKKSDASHKSPNDEEPPEHEQPEKEEPVEPANTAGESLALPPAYNAVQGANATETAEPKQEDTHRLEDMLAQMRTRLDNLSERVEIQQARQFTARPPRITRRPRQRLTRTALINEMRLLRQALSELTKGIQQFSMQVSSRSLSEEPPTSSENPPEQPNSKI